MNHARLHTCRLDEVGQPTSDGVLVIEDHLQVGSTGGGIQLGVDGCWVECQHDFELLCTAQHVTAWGRYFADSVKVVGSFRYGQQV